MRSHYQNYVANFNRVRLSEMIDYHICQARMANARASLVVNPLTGAFYEADEPVRDEKSPSEQI